MIVISLTVCVPTTLYAEGDGRWTEYAGGYTDMIAQRGSGVTARKAAKKEKASKAQSTSTEETSAPKQQKGLTFKDKHLLETLPAKMDDIQGKIDRLRARLEDPDLFSKDPETFNKAAKALEAQEELLAKSRRKMARAGNPAGRTGRKLIWLSPVTNRDHLRPSALHHSSSLWLSAAVSSSP